MNLIKNCIVFVLVIIVYTKSYTQNTVINYTPNTAVIQNPERGFCEYFFQYSKNYTPITLSQLNNLKNTRNHTILLVSFYLDDYLNKDLTSNLLTQITNDFNTIRSAGFKVIVRFAYTKTPTPGYLPPYLDAPQKPQLLKHISQLKPILLANSDVILTLQNGFWGIWGENFYTDFYGNDATAAPTATNWADRKQILDSLLTCIPINRLLSVRTPAKKARYFNQALPSDSITNSEAYNGTAKTRVGGHNDCFLAAADDYTFYNNDTEKPFWEIETKYTIMGGETCNDDATFTNCNNAKSELSKFKWTYINDLYHPDVLARWKTNGCFTEIENKLGYRLKLIKGTFSSNATLGGSFSYNIQIENVGYASTVNPRPVQLFFEETTTKASFMAAINVDLRKWYGGSAITLAGLVQIPTNILAGNYQVYLYLPDAGSTINIKPEYAIQLANTGTWQANTGKNNLLHTLTLTANTPLSINSVKLSANQIDNYAQLSWSATGSSKIEYFEIEKSMEGEIFEKVGLIKSQENETEYIYNMPIIDQKDVYFRLKTKYADQSNQYSNIIQLKAQVKENLTLLTNDCKDSISISTTNNAILNLNIVNIVGKQMYYIENTPEKIEIRCTTWPSGIYFMNYTDNGKIITKKLLVNK